MSEDKVESQKTPKGKIFSIVCTVLTVILAALTCYVLLSIIIAKVKNQPVNLFGSSFSIVMTNSMEPEIMTGDLIVFHICDISEVKQDDNIVFIAGEGFDAAVRGESVVHKAISIVDGGIVTKGVNNAAEDNDLVTGENFLGICTFHSSFFGAMYLFFAKYGIILIVAVIALPIIITQTIKIVKLAKKQKAEGESLPEGTNTDSENAEANGGEEQADSQAEEHSENTQ